MKKVVLLALVLVFSIGVFGQNAQPGFDLSQYGVRIEPDRRLIVVMASLEAAGLETPLTDRGVEFRQQLRADLQDLDKDLRQKMKFFVDQYKRRHAGATDAELVAPFISMAYSLTPVPDLAEPTRTTDLPGSLLEVLDYSPLVRQFYRSTIRVSDKNSPDGRKITTVGARIDEYLKEYQTAGDALRPSTVQMVRELVDYLHTRPQLGYLEQIKTQVQKGKSKSTKLQRIETRERERRFFIVPDLLAKPGTINFRNIGDDYFVIVPPGTDLDESDVRRAYLQFILDPIILKNAKDIAALRDGIKALLDERRKTNPEISPDVFLAVSRSLVAASDARQEAHRRFQEATAEARRTAGRKPLSETIDAQGRKVVQLTGELYLIDGRFAMPAVEDEVALKLSEAYERGAVLAFYFAQQLKGLEDSGFDIASSLRDMILSLDPAKEADRLAEFADARKRAQAVREENRQKALAVLENPLTKRLLEIEPMIQTQKYADAETELRGLIEKNPGDPRLYYNLGRVLSLSAASLTDIDRRNELLKEAQKSFVKVLDAGPDKVEPALKSLTYVALGRIYEYYDEDAYAIKIYEAAINVGNVKGGAYQEAIAARQRLLNEQ